MSLGHYWGLYLGLFIILSLVLTIARRVIPFFIERGVGYPVTLANSVLKDRLSLLTFLLFFVLEIFTPWRKLAGVMALAAAVVQIWRLAGWYTSVYLEKTIAMEFISGNDHDDYRFIVVFFVDVFTSY